MPKSHKFIPAVIILSSVFGFRKKLRYDCCLTVRRSLPSFIQDLTILMTHSEHKTSSTQGLRSNRSLEKTWVFITMYYCSGNDKIAWFSNVGVFKMVDHQNYINICFKNFDRVMIRFYKIYNVLSFFTYQKSFIPKYFLLNRNEK